MLKLYDYASSGNGYKVRLGLHQLGLPCQRIELDIMAGQTRTPRFLARNPNGRIPCVELESGEHLWESNAILCYFAEGSELMPTDSLERARVLQWMFFEQYSHEPYIATSRFLLMHGEDTAERRAALAQRLEPGYAALAVMERHLAGRAFVGDGYSIADVALYAYTHVADEGGFGLARFPEVCAWLARVREQPKHIPITQT